jgi:hypothetical protein
MLTVPENDMPVNQWSLTLHGSGGIVSQFDSQEAQFVLGTEEASDVLRVVGDGIAPRHAWVLIAEEIAFHPPSRILQPGRGSVNNVLFSVFLSDIFEVKILTLFGLFERLGFMP